MEESIYVTVERDVLPQGDAATVGLVVKYAFRMTMAGKAAAIYVVPARRSV